MDSPISKMDEFGELRTLLYVPESINSQKVTAWVAVSSRGVVESFFFLSDTVTSKRHLQILHDLAVTDALVESPAISSFMQNGERPQQIAEVFCF